MLFRWVVQDVELPLLRVWRRRGWGFGLGDGPQRCHLLWIKDTWLLAHEVWEMEAMCRELAEAMRAHIGLRLRPEKCMLAVFGPSPESIAPSEELPAIERLSGDDCLSLLGDHLQVDGGASARSFGSRSPRLGGFPSAEVLLGSARILGLQAPMLHMAVRPVLSSCGGNRH